MVRFIKEWAVPRGGVGFVTIEHYPKLFDYAVVLALILIGAAIGWWWRTGSPASPDRRHHLSSTLVISLVVFLLMLFVHDNPYELMETFHEGEHLTPAFLFRQGERPFGDVFLIHGLAVDGGLDALVLGTPPSPLRERRLETVLDAATLALLVPIAAELCVTAAGTAAAVIAGLCAVGAAMVPVFPYFRFAPIFLSALGLLWFIRTGRGVLLACIASTVGVLWSLDTGLYALGGTAICLAILRPPLKRVVFAAAIAVVVALAILLAARADLSQFVVDSFVIIPRSIDAIWSLPARTTFDWESARYYIPPLVFGWLLAMGIRNRDRRAIVIAVLSILAFRSAAGRCSWSHTRYGIPLFGVAVVAFALEPLVLKKRRFAALALAIPLIVLVELVPNAVSAAKFLAGWRGRQSHAGLVSYPLATGRGIYTTPDDARDLAALNGFLERYAPPGASILDLSNEKALYYLLQRRPATRCFDVAFLSSPPLASEAMREVRENPPAAVILAGRSELAGFDGVTNRARVPWLFSWAERNYPRQMRIGRFVVATK